MPSNGPTWDAKNLTRHHRKRVAEDPGCFEDLLGIVGVAMTESQYDLRSMAAVDKSWAEYEGESWEVKTQQYAEARAYFVDDELVVAVTDGFRNVFVTCFHEHFGRSHVAHSRGASVGQLRLLFRQHLTQEEQGRQIRKVRRLRGFNEK